MRNFLGLVLLVAMLDGPSFAQSQRGGADQQSEALTEQRFASEVASGNLFIIESSRLALEKSTNDESKSFAGTIIADRTQAMEDFRAVAKRIKVAWPTALNDEHRALLDQLRTTSGDLFNGQYGQMQVQEHESAVTLLARYASHGQNQQFQQWAQNNIQRMKDHLELAKKLTRTAPPPRG